MEEGDSLTPRRGREEEGDIYGGKLDKEEAVRGYDVEGVAGRPVKVLKCKRGLECGLCGLLGSVTAT